MNKFCDYKKVYTDIQEALIDGEFSRIQDQCFLDHAGATLYSQKQIENIFQELSINVYSNPHAKNVSSKLTEDAVDIIRFKILRYFNTNSEEYSVIFTSNATNAIKIVAEYFNYENDSKNIGALVYLDDNHTSVLGMRGYAKNIQPLITKEATDLFSQNDNSTLQISTENYDSHNSLFVYPAQSNFSGTKYPLSWIKKVHNGRLNRIHDVKTKNWYVLLDAASYVGSNRLNLNRYKPDFVPISFYKMFGYPTGLGALLVRNSSADVLKKKYFGGGTVQMAMSLKDVTVPRQIINERFEDGTISFLSIMSINHGFDTLHRLNLNMESICPHTFTLAQYVYRNLLCLHHSNGKPVVIFYHDTQFTSYENQGGIVNFNLLRNNAEYVGYSEVLHMSNLYNIHVRTGCSCNPGACQRHLQLTSEDVQRHFDAGHICSDQNDLVDGYPTGSVRVSFGYMSRKKDADALLKMIENCFVTKPIIKKIPQSYQKSLSENANDKQMDEEILQVCKKPQNCDNCPTKTSSLNENVNINLKQKILLQNNQLEHIDSNIDTRISGKLVTILLYPIKSCGALQVDKIWETTPQGLKYDRQWMIVNKSGTCFSQKHNTLLCLVKPTIDLNNDKLVLKFPNQNDIALPLTNTTNNIIKNCESKVCGDKIIGNDCGEQIAKWLEQSLDSHGLRLVQHVQFSDEQSSRITKTGENLNLSLANKAQYLLINVASVRWLLNKIEELHNETLESIVLRFRPNFVVDFGEPFIENEMKTIRINKSLFNVTGHCNRCQMICINQTNGEKTKEPLSTLAKEFKGSIQFGIYLCEVSTEQEGFVVLRSNVIGEK